MPTRLLSPSLVFGLLAAATLFPSTAAASCIATSGAELERRAKVIVKGTFLEGPALGRQLLSPARFRVGRYLKGHGPRRLEVDAGTRRDGEFIQTRSDGLTVRAGERWKLLDGRISERGQIKIGSCDGSKRLSRARS